MKKLNLGNITAGLDTIKKLAEENSTIARDEVIDVKLIDCAEKNTYAADDTDETIKDLADQIASVGLLNPLGVIKDGERYKLFSGERRYKAITKFLHWATVPCRVFEGVSTGRAQLMLHIANKQRNLSASRQLEIFEEYYKLLKELEQNGEVTGNLVQAIAKEMEISERQVRKYRAISERLTDEERGLLSAGTLTVNEASRIAAIRAEESKTETVAPITETTAGEIMEPSSAPVVPSPEPKTEENPEPSSAPAAPVTEPKTEVKPEPGSAERQIIVTEEDIRQEFLRTVILSEQVWSIKKILDFYIQTMPTPQEAIKQLLKPRYGYAGGTININGDVGHCTLENGKMIICMHTKRIKTIVYKYSEVDAVIRELYREGLLEDDTEDEEDAEYLDIEEDLISEELE